MTFKANTGHTKSTFNLQSGLEIVLFSKLESITYIKILQQSGFFLFLQGYSYVQTQGVCGVMVTVLRNEHNDLSSNPKQDYLHFT